MPPDCRRRQTHNDQPTARRRLSAERYLLGNERTRFIRAAQGSRRHLTQLAACPDGEAPDPQGRSQQLLLVRKEDIDLSLLIYL